MATGRQPKASINLYDDTLLTSDSSFNLYLSVGEGKLSYALYNSIEQKFISLVHYSDIFEYEIASILSADKHLLNSNIESSKILVSEQSAEFVPEQLLNQEYVEHYNKFITTEVPVKTHHTSIEEISSHLIFSSDQTFIDHLPVKLKPIKLHHIYQPLMAVSLAEHKADQQEYLVVNILGSKIQIIAIQNGNLLAANQFTVSSTDDFTYFILAFAEQFGFNPQFMQLILQGELEEQSKYAEHIEQYVKSVIKGKRPKALKYSTELNDIPDHQFYHLFGMALCE